MEDNPRPQHELALRISAGLADRIGISPGTRGYCGSRKEMIRELRVIAKKLDKAARYAVSAVLVQEWENRRQEIEQIREALTASQASEVCVVIDTGYVKPDDVAAHEAAHAFVGEQGGERWVEAADKVLGDLPEYRRALREYVYCVMSRVGPLAREEVLVRLLLCYQGTPTYRGDPLSRRTVEQLRDALVEHGYTLEVLLSEIEGRMRRSRRVG